MLTVLGRVTQSTSALRHCCNRLWTHTYKASRFPALLWNKQENPDCFMCTPMDCNSLAEIVVTVCSANLLLWMIPFRVWGTSVPATSKQRWSDNVTDFTFRTPLKVWECYIALLSISVSLEFGPGPHPTSYAVGNVSLSRGYCGWGVASSTELHLALWLKKEESYTLTTFLGLRGLLHGEL